jgi:hypothetical protein
MRSFKDANGKEWPLVVNITTRQRVLTDTQFDLFGVVDAVELEKLEDPALLVSVIFSLCSVEAQKAGISPEQFASGMVGDALDGASEALMGAVSDFFPRRRRTVMTAALAKGTQLADGLMAKALEKITAMDLESLMPPASKSTSMSSPVSSGSTPPAPN